MARIPVTRAPALPSASAPVVDHRSTPYRSIAHHARTRGEDLAYVVGPADQTLARTWAEVAATVEQAGAGLLRSGLRADQVVLSLLPAGHAYPELDLALRIIGAVVVNVSPDATSQDLARELSGARPRLIVTESEAGLERLRGLGFARAELFALDGGRGWAHLLRLGAERLTMDPDAVSRVDQVVDPADAQPRLLRPGVALSRVERTREHSDLLRAGDVAMVVGHLSDPLVQLMHEAHLSSGATLRVVPDAVEIVEALDVLAPAVIALSADARSALTGRDRRLIAGTGVSVVDEDVARVIDADLPQPPPITFGDPSLLPRRSRGAPGREFQIGPEPGEDDGSNDEPADSAFKLPSLPLFGGDSVLDQLLLAQARAGTS